LKILTHVLIGVMARAKSAQPSPAGSASDAGTGVGNLEVSPSGIVWSL